MTRELTPEDADWYRTIGREWERIQWCMYDSRIAAVFRALRDQCRDPQQPTNLEAGRARMALVAEIDALDVEPRPPYPKRGAA